MFECTRMLFVCACMRNVCMHVSYIQSRALHVNAHSIDAQPCLLCAYTSMLPIGVHVFCVFHTCVHVCVPWCSLWILLCACVHACACMCWPHPWEGACGWWGGAGSSRRPCPVLCSSHAGWGSFLVYPGIWQAGARLGAAQVGPRGSLFGSRLRTQQIMSSAHPESGRGRGEAGGQQGGPPSGPARDSEDSRGAGGSGGARAIIHLSPRSDCVKQTSAAPLAQSCRH